MKLYYEEIMHFIICISINVCEAASFFDENEYYDLDGIPYIPFNPQKMYIPKETDDSIKSSKLSVTSSIESSYPPHSSFASNVATKFQFETYNQNEESLNPKKNFKIQRNLNNEPFPLSYNTDGNNSTNEYKGYIVTLQDFVNSNGTVRNPTFHDIETIDKPIKFNFSNFNDANKTNFFNISCPDATDSSVDRNFSETTSKKNMEFDVHSFSKFFDSLLSLLSYLNPNLLNFLETNIKNIQMYNKMKRNSVSNGSTYPNNESAEASTLRTMSCNCEYCLTGTPDTALLIVSGKKLKSNVTMHKLKSYKKNLVGKNSTSLRHHMKNDNRKQGFHKSLKHVTTVLPKISITYGRQLSKNFWSTQKVIAGRMTTKFYFTLPTPGMYPKLHKFNMELKPDPKILLGQGFSVTRKKNDSVIDKIQEFKNNKYETDILSNNYKSSHYTTKHKNLIKNKERYFSLYNYLDYLINYNSSSTDRNVPFSHDSIENPVTAYGYNNIFRDFTTQWNWNIISNGHISSNNKGMARNYNIFAIDNRNISQVMGNKSKKIVENKSMTCKSTYNKNKKINKVYKLPLPNYSHVAKNKVKPYKVTMGIKNSIFQIDNDNSLDKENTDCPTSDFLSDEIINHRLLNHNNIYILDKRSGFQDNANLRNIYEHISENYKKYLLTTGLYNREYLPKLKFKTSFTPGSNTTSQNVEKTENTLEKNIVTNNYNKMQNNKKICSDNIINIDEKNLIGTVVTPINEEKYFGLALKTTETNTNSEHLIRKDTKRREIIDKTIGNVYTIPITATILDSINDITNDKMVRHSNIIKVHTMKPTNSPLEKEKNITIPNLEQESNKYPEENLENEFAANLTGEHRYEDGRSELTTNIESTILRINSVEQSIISPTIKTSKLLNSNSNVQKETNLNYDLNLESMIGEANVDEKIMLS